MRVHWLQNSPTEGLGLIEDWLRRRGHALSRSLLFAGEGLPTAEAFDWLIALGGPMNIYQYRDHPWLRGESHLLAEACAAGKRVLGICLGSQLLSDALGGKVFQNAEREIGWFPVRAVPEGAGSPFRFPDETVVLHWHGDTFSLPPGATRLAKSDGCENQAFAVGSRVLGLQFHPEMSERELAPLAAEEAAAIGSGRYVQPADRILAGARQAAPAAALLGELLGALERG